MDLLRKNALNNSKYDENVSSDVSGNSFVRQAILLPDEKLSKKYKSSPKCKTSVSSLHDHSIKTYLKDDSLELKQNNKLTVQSCQELENHSTDLTLTTKLDTVNEFLLQLQNMKRMLHIFSNEYRKAKIKTYLNKIENLSLKNVIENEINLTCKAKLLRTKKSSSGRNLMDSQDSLVNSKFYVLSSKNLQCNTQEHVDKNKEIESQEKRFSENSLDGDEENFQLTFKSFGRGLNNIKDKDKNVSTEKEIMSSKTKPFREQQNIKKKTGLLLQDEPQDENFKKPNFNLHRNLENNLLNTNKLKEPKQFKERQNIEKRTSFLPDRTLRNRETINYNEKRMGIVYVEDYEYIQSKKPKRKNVSSVRMNSKKNPLTIKSIKVPG